MSTRIFSIESGNKQTSIIGYRDKQYIDVDLNFDIKTSTKDLYSKIDIEAVKQAVKHILLTRPFEKPYDPHFGTNLASILFELDSQIDNHQVFGEVKQSIELYEPRAKVLSVDFEVTNSNSAHLTVVFKEVNTAETVTINVVVKRIR